ncbi:unnamed protein product [Closterium sp. NIES-54]
MCAPPIPPIPPAPPVPPAVVVSRQGVLQILLPPGYSAFDAFLSEPERSGSEGCSSAPEPRWGAPADCPLDESATGADDDVEFWVADGLPEHLPIPSFPPPNKKRPHPSRDNGDARPPSPRHKPTKHRRNSYTSHEKLQWILKLEAGEMSVQRMSREYVISRRCLTWKNRKGELEGAHGARCRLHGRGRSSWYLDMEAEVYLRFLAHSKKCLAVSIARLQKWSHEVESTVAPLLLNPRYAAAVAVAFRGVLLPLLRAATARWQQGRRGTGEGLREKGKEEHGQQAQEEEEEQDQGVPCQGREGEKGDSEGADGMEWEGEAGEGKRASEGRWRRKMKAGGKRGTQAEGQGSREDEEEEGEGRGERRVEEYETVCEALSIVLAIAPHSVNHLRPFFAAHPPPFLRLLLCDFNEGASAEDPSALLPPLRTSLRLLLTSLPTFASLWDWSPLFPLLLPTSSSPHQHTRSDEPEEASNNGGRKEEAGRRGEEEWEEVRWVVLEIVSLVLSFDEATRTRVGSALCALTATHRAHFHFRWRQLATHVEAERAPMFLLSPLHSASLQATISDADASATPGTDPSGASAPSPLSPLHAPVLTTSGAGFSFDGGGGGEGEAASGGGGGGAGVLTASSTSRFNTVAMDGKTLLGSYVCTDVPGEFEWRPGVLTLAAARGLWVLLENISGAPFDLLSSLLPLLQDRCLHLPGHSQPLQAADGFQIFATKAVAASSSLRSSAASGGESAKVASGVPLSSSLLQHHQHQQQLIAAVAEAAASGGISVRYSRQVSLRDTMKIALRLHSLPLPASIPTQPTPTLVLPLTVRERIYFEVVDCLVACVASPEQRCALMAHLALLCGLPTDYALQLHSLYQPTVHASSLELRVGRAVVPLRLHQANDSSEGNSMAFAATGAVLRLMERVAVCVGQREPVLLVGETGTGKTTTVQHLARMAGRGLSVINMSQHSDSADFLGGFKPVEQRVVCLALYHSFTSLFSNTFPSQVPSHCTPLLCHALSQCNSPRFPPLPPPHHLLPPHQRNAEFLLRLSRLAAKGKWPLLLSAFRSTALKVAHLLAPAPHTDARAPASTTAHAPAAAAGTAGAAGADSDGGGATGSGSGDAGGGSESGKPERSAKRTKRLDGELAQAWARFSTDLARAERQVAAAEASFAFMFVEGALVRALREGHWLLMDEINLAPPETLERLSGVLEGDAGSLAITERGDIEAVPRHPDFRLFAAMNPATDVGKRDLPPAIRSRFTELFVDEITSRQELGSIVFKPTGAGQYCLQDLFVDEIISRQDLSFTVGCGWGGVARGGIGWSWEGQHTATVHSGRQHCVLLAVAGSSVRLKLVSSIVLYRSAVK